MTVARTAIGAGDRTDNEANATFAHTVPSGSGRLLLVGVCLRGGSDQVNTVDYGAQSMTRLLQVIRSTTSVVEVFGLVAPAVGTANVVVDFTDNFADAVANSISYDGVGQQDPTGDVVSSNAATSASPSISGIVAALGDIVSAILGVQVEGTITVAGTGVAGWEDETGIGDASGAMWDVPGEADSAVTANATLAGSAAYIMAGFGIHAAPAIESVTPAAAATGVSVTAPVRIDFTRVMNDATLVSPNVTLRPVGGSPVAATITVDGDDLGLEIEPDVPLEYSTEYEIRVTTAALDTRTNAILAQHSTTFTTEADPTPPEEPDTGGLNPAVVFLARRR